MIRTVEHLNKVALSVFYAEAINTLEDDEELITINQMAWDLYSFNADDDLKAVVEAAQESATYFKRQLELAGVKLNDERSTEN